MGQYSSYKDSGFEWIGKIPSHWGLLKSKFLWRESFDTSATGMEDLLSVSQYDGVTPANGSHSESLVGYKVVEENNLVINIMLAWMGGLGVSAFNGLVSPAYCVYKLLGDNNPKYMHYLYKTPMYLAEFARHSTGVIPSRWRMYTDDFGQVISLIPPRKEQDAMVAYLDAATAKIDEAIAQQQRMIDLLNERKQIIINDAVSSGLGNEFSALTSFEERESITIPKGWRLLPLKAKISFVNGYAFDSESFMKEGEVPVIRISNISDGTVSYDDIVYVDRDKGLEPFLTKGGDLLIAMSGATTGKVGFDIDGGSYINQRVGIIRSSCQKWVYYWLMTSFFKEYVYLSALGSAQPNISSSGIKNFRILYPEDGNYSNIVDRLDVICLEIDKALGAFQHQIDLLQERKQIIINDVVTGKVKVV